MNLSPLNRNNKFFSEREFNYYSYLAREYMKTSGQEIYFIKVDKQQTEIDDVYNEGYIGEISYFEPIIIPALVKLEEPDNKAYVENKGAARFEEYGNLIVHFLLEDLQQDNTEITYGDFIGYRVSETQVLYFEVANDAQKHFENSKTYMGYKSYWKSVVCTPTNKTFDIT
jgi:hypothetical protein